MLNSNMIKEQCTGCGSCVLSCPKNCIALIADKEGFLYPEQISKCIDCGLCESVCPINKVNVLKEAYPIQTYACMAKDENIRMGSSSGGIFSLLAKETISKGGIVFGAAFNENFEVAHIGIDNIEELHKLRGSKYVQSKTSDSFQEVKIALDLGKSVLFSGTPCQVAGLRAYLKKPHDNLTTVDLICHGVPSPIVWQKYLRCIKTREKTNIKNVNFRSKIIGWKNFCLLVDFDNNKQYVNSLFSDAYMQAFLKNFSLRPSCYKCKFKGIERVSDISLADFWGIENVKPELNDDKGISVVILNSQKAQDMFSAINKDTTFSQVDLLDVVKYNPAIIDSALLPKERELFMRKVTDKNFVRLVNKINKNTIFDKIMRRIKKLVKK